MSTARHGWRFTTWVRLGGTLLVALAQYGVIAVRGLWRVGRAVQDARREGDRGLGRVGRAHSSRSSRWRSQVRGPAQISPRIVDLRESSTVTGRHQDREECGTWLGSLAARQDRDRCEVRAVRAAMIATAVRPGLRIALGDDRRLTGVAILHLTTTVSSRMSRSCRRHGAPNSPRSEILAGRRLTDPLPTAERCRRPSAFCFSAFGARQIRQSAATRAESREVSSAVRHAGPNSRPRGSRPGRSQRRQDRDRCEVRAALATMIATAVRPGLPIAPRDDRGLTDVAILHLTTTAVSRMSRSWRDVRTSRGPAALGSRRPARLSALGARRGARRAKVDSTRRLVCGTNLLWATTTT